MKYKDPFLGEIELNKLGETSRHAIGESIVDTIYVDNSGNYYIDTWTTTGGDKEPMLFLRKTLIDKINELSKNDKLDMIINDIKIIKSNTSKSTLVKKLVVRSDNK